MDELAVGRFAEGATAGRHDHICESLELFAERVMPDLKEREDDRVRRKMEALAPHLEEAMKRKRFMEPLVDAEIPEMEALGRQVVQ